MTVVLTHIFKLLSFFPFLFAVFYLFIFTLSQLGAGITEILRYGSFQNGGCLPSSVFENSYFDRVTVTVISI